MKGSSLLGKHVSGYGGIKNAAMMLGPGIAIGLLTGETPGEKLKNVAGNTLFGMLTMGMSPVRGIAYQTLISSAPAMGQLGVKVSQGWRSSLEQRTAAAIPFSHSTSAMDHAGATLAYAQQRVASANGSGGGMQSTAAFYAARLTAHRHF